MPISDFTSKLLELEDVIISDLKTTNTEVHVFFSLKEKLIVALIVVPLPKKSMITVLLSSKIFLLWGKRLSSITAKDATIVLAVRNIFMNLFLCFLSTAVLPPGSLFMRSIY